MKSRSLDVLFLLPWLAILVVDSIEAWRSRELGRHALTLGITVVSIAGFFVGGRYVEQRKGGVWASRFYSVIAVSVAVIVVAFLAYVRFW